MVKRRLKKKYSIFLITIFFLICLTGIIYSLFKIINWKKDVDDNQNITKKIKENITIDEESNLYQIDFNFLKQTNDDTIAYIKVNGTNIEYVVVKGTDNSYYLTHNFENKSNIAGWIFGDYHNNFDETDKNLILYGHDTKDGSMFGTLKKILSKDWYENEDNYIVVFVTEKAQYMYQVFSTYSIKSEDFYINTEFNDNDEFDKFVRTLRLRSIYDYGVEVSGEDKILTLSSCLGDGTKRVVLHAKLINQIEF